jgi:hypothetical protein
MKIHFYNQDREVVMSFSEFNLQTNEPDFHNFVLFKINVNYSFIQASIKTECLDIDFDKFFIDLRRLYNMEIKTVSFVQTIEKNIMINFNLTEFGHILVRVTIKKQIDSTRLQFEYGIDQSFLPELIEEISAVIEQ